MSGGQLERQHARGDQRVQPQTIRTRLELADARQRGVAQLAHEVAVGGGVHDARIGWIGEIQAARAIGGHAQRSPSSVRQADGQQS